MSHGHVWSLAQPISMCYTLQYNVYPETCCILLIWGGWKYLGIILVALISDYRSNIILTCAKRMQINHVTNFNTQQPYGSAITTMNKQDARGKTLIYGERKQATQQQQQHHRDMEIELRQNDWRDPVFFERRVICCRVWNAVDFRRSSLGNVTVSS